MLTLSAAPRQALLHSFIPLRELRSSFSWCWGFRNGTILPFVFYCNILMLLLSGLLRGIFHSPLRSLCLGMRKHSQEYSALPEGIFLFSQVGGKNVKPELLLWAFLIHMWNTGYTGTHSSFIVSRTTIQRHSVPEMIAPASFGIKASLVSTLNRFMAFPPTDVHTAPTRLSIRCTAIKVIRLALCCN